MSLRQKFSQRISAAEIFGTSKEGILARETSFGQLNTMDTQTGGSSGPKEKGSFRDVPPTKIKVVARARPLLPRELKLKAGIRSLRGESLASAKSPFRTLKRDFVRLTYELPSGIMRFSVVR